MTGPRPGVLDYALLVGLAATWGASFMLIKIAVDTVPPLTMTAGRVAVGVCIFAAILLATGRRLPSDPRVWGWAALAGIFGIAVPFSLISWGEQRIDSGLAAILMTGMPLMTLMLARFVARDEPLTANKLVGVGLGMAGLVVLIGPEKLLALGDDTISQLAIVLASFCYAVNAIVSKRIASQDPFVVSICIMICGIALLAPASILLDAPWTLRPSVSALLTVGLLGLFPTALANIVLLVLLRRQGAGFFSQVNFLVPLFGVFWGFAILSERVTLAAMIALAFVLAGVAMSRGVRKPLRFLSTETSR